MKIADKTDDNGVNMFLSNFIRHIEQARLNLHGIQVTQAGIILGEHYWLKDTPHELRSLSKSFAACAIGLAAEEGRLTLDDTVVDFFDHELIVDSDPRIRELTIRHLLTMAHGRNKSIMLSHQRALITDPDWVRHFLAYPLDYAPGEQFVYDTGATYMLSAVMQAITGQTLRAYLMPRLFEPLGIDNPRWDICPLGRTLGGAGLHLTVAQIGHFGTMLLHEGQWADQQLVPQAYVQQATTTQIETGDHGGGIDSILGYGFQFWMCRHGSYRGYGADGQFCIVIPRMSTVIAITAQERKTQAILDAVWDTVLPLL
ncbi:MAG: serine hydrolase domain-containing protein [Chloroflexota bacterium]